MYLIKYLGNDRYFAALKDLPTYVETHKTLDDVGYYKVSDIGQILEVSNIKDIPGNSRPTFDEISNEPKDDVKENKKRDPNDFTLDNGLTPPTIGIKDGFKEISTKVDPNDVKKFDGLLLELESEIAKRERSTEEAHKPYVFEEIIDEEPYMEYWDEKTEIEQGKDNFLSSTRKAYDLAYERYLKVHPEPKPLTETNVHETINTLNEVETKKEETFEGLLEDDDFGLFSNDME